MRRLLSSRVALVLLVCGSGCTAIYGGERSADGGSARDLGAGDGAGRVWSPATSGTAANLYAVWGCRSGDVNAVGAAGTILHSTSFGVWTARTSTADDLFAVVGTDCRTVYAASARGNVFTSNGNGTWTGPDMVSGSALVGLWADAQTAVVVGRGGNLFQNTGGGPGSWISAGNMPTMKDLDAVWGATSLLYAAGSGGALLRSTNTGMRWQAVASGTGVQLRGGATFGMSQLVVGDSGTVLRSSGGGAFTALPAPTTATLRSVWAASATELFAVGDGGLILHSTDGAQSWSQETSGVATHLNAVWGASATEVYVVGDGGVILHRP